MIFFTQPFAGQVPVAWRLQQAFNERRPAWGSGEQVRTFLKYHKIIPG